MNNQTTVYPIDDFKKELVPRLEGLRIYNQFLAICSQDPAGVDALNIINDAINYSYHRHKMIMGYMGEFTLHDSEHLFRILHLMGELIPDTTLKKLSTAELMLLILTAFFHDIGMAPSEITVRAWNGVFEGEVTEKLETERIKFTHFLAGRTKQKSKIDKLRSEGQYGQAEYLMRHLISEYIRITHAERAVEVLKEDWNNKIKYRDINLTNLLAQLCRSHNDESIKLLQLDHLKPLGQVSYLCLPFVGIILRIADILDFDAKRTPNVLYSHLLIKDPTSIQEWNKHRAITNWTIKPGTIRFSATCSHPAIEAGIRQFGELIDYELRAATTILSNLHDNLIQPFPEHYRIPLAAQVDLSHVKADEDLEGKPIYLYRDSGFNLNRSQIIDLLMGTKLYGEPSVALRELLQNSIDTCILREQMELKWGNTYIPKISIVFLTGVDGTILKINDNGVGMDQYIVDKFYSNIGTSFYNSTEFLELKSELGSTYIPTSRFGIGILSCFMISDDIQVETRRVYDNHSFGEPLLINIQGQDSIFYIRAGNILSPGTTTTLNLRDTNPWKDKTQDQIFTFIKKTLPFPPFPIEVSIGDRSFIHNPITPQEINLDDLKRDYNSKNDYLKVFELIFDGSEGITGKGEVIIIEENGIPKEKIGIQAHPLNVNGKEVILTSFLEMDENKIYHKQEQFDYKKINDDLSTHFSHSYLRESKSAISLHGIELPFSLFSKWDGDIYQRSKMHWPICVLLKINIAGKLDLNLNSARTEVLRDDKWFEFERVLSREILQKIREQVTPEYWSELKTWLIDKKDKENNLFMEQLEII